MTIINLKAVLSTLAILTLLFLTIMAPQSAESAATIKAPNSIGLEIQSPLNHTYNSSVPIILQVQLVYGMETDQFYTGLSTRDITCKYCLDNGEWFDVPFGSVIVNRTQWDLNHPFINLIVFAYNTSLYDLSPGPHTISFATSPYTQDFVFNTDNGKFTKISSQVNFNMYTSLNLTILSPENQTYPTNSLQLNFTVNQPTSSLSYSLDKQTNHTITGNMTLNGLTQGSHSITLFANDTSDNMGASKTIYFDIEQPDQPFSILPVVAIASLVSLILAVVILIYFKRR